MSVRERDRKDYTVELEVGLDMYESASENALSRLADLGLDAFGERPRGSDGEYFDGRLPSNVNDLSISDLSELFQHMEEHANWVSGYVMAAKAAVENTEEQLKLVKSRIRKTKSGTQAEKDNDTLCDSRFVEANAKWLEAKEYLVLLTGIAEAARRDLKLISRLVEIRRIEFDQGRRGRNLDGGSRDRFTNAADRSPSTRRRRGRS